MRTSPSISALMKACRPVNRMGLVVSCAVPVDTGRGTPAGQASPTDANPSRRRVASPVLHSPGRLVPGTPPRPLT